jgi:kumamolisin
MSITLHVPRYFESLSDLKRLISSYGIAISHLHPNSKSLQLVGALDIIQTVLIKIREQFGDSIVTFQSDHAPKLRTPIRYPRADLDSTNPNTYTPIQISKIYGFPPDNTNPANIAIIELGGGYQISDLQTYWNNIGVAPPNIIPISVDGVGNTPGSAADGEVVLDIEVIGGLIPNSNIYVYFAPNTDQGFYDAIHAAVYDTEHNPMVISISWGGPEDQWMSTQLTAFNELFELASQKGINICVASGDNGSSDGETGGNHVDFPAASPFVLACGGTNLVCSSGVYDSDTQEICWGGTPNDGAGGGGFSTVFPVPDYQKSLDTTMRGVPDVAGVADPMTGWIVYLNGQTQVIGGTSAVAPMWAAYLAKMGIKKFINDILYTAGKAGFHDIITGTNGAYNAAPGWDPVTGLGSLNGYILNAILEPYTS